jgi:nucleotidyltransferase/DNA polymerase involved in DNA repair
MEHAQRHGIADTDAEAYFTEVQSNALRASVGAGVEAAFDEFLHNCQLIAVRMCTTCATLASGKELCSILNEAVRI